MLLYCIQAFSFLAVIVSTFCKTKKNILTWVFIANFSNFLVMLVAQETDGWAGSLATTLRALLFLNKDKAKTNLILYIGILLHMIAFLLSYQDLFSFCILCATLCVCISQWFGSALQIKIFAFISIVFWIIYTLHIELYFDLPKRIIEGVFLLISIFSICRKKKIQETENTC